MMFAQGLLDLGLSETVLHIIRIIASVAGAVVGWFACDLLTRGLYRLSFRGATPGSLLFIAKVTGAGALSLLVYFFLPLGGGGAGFGWGPGLGGGPGKGAGQGGDKAAVSDGASKDGKDAKPPAKEKIDPSSKATLESIQIEIISRDRFNYEDGKDRFYLLKREDPAISLIELEDYFKKNGTKIEITPVLTRLSIPDGEKDMPLHQLLELRKKYNVKTLQTKGP
jgi:hypothetical protein